MEVNRGDILILYGDKSNLFQIVYATAKQIRWRRLSMEKYSSSEVDKKYLDAMNKFGRIVNLGNYKMLPKKKAIDKLPEMIKVLYL